MKKIFAFVLATIMVLSLVPASVFAAITKACPETHTLSNCEYTFVEEQKATCAKVGYKVYECNECGEQFLADFVKTLEHNWESNAKKDVRVDVPVDCKKEKDGITYLICKDCDAYPKQTDTNISGIVETDTNGAVYVRTPWQTAHKLGAATGFGCEAKSKCSVCSKYFYGFDSETGYGKTEAHHNYEFTKIASEPERVDGKTVKGQALYTCKDCGTPKYVDIFAPDCRCYGYQDIYCTLIIAAKDATCDATGTLAVYECDDCNQLYSYNKSSKKYAAIEKIEDAVIKALGHTPKKNTSETKGCTTTYTCDRKGCGMKVTEYAHDKGDAYIVVSEYSYATCIDYGYSVWLCNYCGWNDAVFTAPTGHDVKTVDVAATCKDYGYTFTYCANETCYIIINGVSAVNAPVTTKWVNGYNYNVAIEDEDGNLVGVPVLEIKRGTTLNTAAHDYECIASNPVNCGTAGYEVYKCKNCGVIYTKTIAAVEHQFDESKTEYVSASCSQAGYILKTCANCGAKVTVATLPATPGVHNYEVIQKNNNCANPTADIYFDSTGRRFHTREIYQCTGCTATITVHSNPYPTAPKTTFDSLEEAELYHVGSATLNTATGEWVYDSKWNGLEHISTQAATCYSTGSSIYKCNDCNALVYVTLPKADHPAEAKIDTAAKAATCKASGNIAYSTCYICNTIYVIKDGKQVNISLAETITNPHSATLSAQVMKDCQGNVIGTYYKCTGKDCGKLFTDTTASTTYTGVTVANAKKHTWTTLVPYVAATCNKEGVVGIDYCSVCGKYQITENYLTAAKNELKKFTSDALTKAEAEAYVLKCYESGKAPAIEIFVSANKVVTAKSIAIPMANHGYDAETETYKAIASESVNSKDCSKPSFTHNYCVLCNHEYLDNYKPASSSKGHVNKSGVSLVGDCGYLQGIKDRQCFYCDTKVEPEHTTLTDAIVVEATCSTDGYTYNYCVDCGYKVVKNSDIIFADADAYHADEDNRVKVGVSEDYANNGDFYWACNVCGKQLTETQKVACPGAGLEIVLSADAESYIAGSTVKVTVSLDSLKGVNVWGISFPVTFNPEYFQFLGYTFNTNGDFQTFVVNEIEAPTINKADGKVSADAQPVGVISIAANAEENVLVKGSQDLVTLEFKVITSYAGQVAISVVEEAASVPVGVTTNSFGSFYVTKDFTLDVVDEKGKALTNVLYDATSEDLYIDLKAFLNVNGDDEGKVDMADALALYEYIVFDEYDVVADANCDGKVTMEDLTILYNIITGVITVDDIINPVVEEEIQYDENGNAILPEDFVPGIDGARD